MHYSSVSNSPNSGGNSTTNNYLSVYISPWYQGYEFYNELFYPVITALFIYVIVGIPGNVLIIVSLFKNSHLTTSYNILLCNLAVADLLLTAYVVVFDTIDLLYGRFPGPFMLCQFNAFMIISLKFVSISSLMVIALNRCCQICYFAKSAKIFSLRNVYLICAVQWMYGWILAGLPLFCCSDLTYDKLIHECSYDRYKSTSYTVIVVGTVIGFPVSISLACYVKILTNISRRNAKVNTQLQSVILQRHIREIRSVKTQLAVFIAFMVVTTPYGLTAMFADASPNLVVLHAAVNILGHANSVINCFIYGIMNKRIRQEYKDIIMCKTKDSRNDFILSINSTQRNQVRDLSTKESML